jgi:aldose 1-epimerase
VTSNVDFFGETPDGMPVKRVSIAGGGLTAHILTFGATVQDLRMEGVSHPLVLGAPSLEPYFGPLTYFGAIVGRFANRIGQGRFKLDGQTHETPRNWLDRHTLHGGPVGTGQKLWTIGETSENSLRLDLVLADGDMGFPGEMTVIATFSLPGDGVLAIDIRARADAATPCSFAHHGYFNLDASPDITGHRLRIDADTYLPVDADLIPTGEIAPVEGTAFDFRAPREVGTSGLDHNFCLSNGREPLRPVAELRSPVSGLAMTIQTTEPGLQIYDGAYIPEKRLEGLDGRKYGPFGGIAMETQSWPDALNRPAFPSAVIGPGDTYHHQVRYEFQREGSP